MLRLKRFKEGVWFDVPNFEGVKVKVRPISYSQTTKIMSKHKTKVEVDGKIVDDYDEMSLTLELFRYILEDFKGIEVEEDLTKDEIKELIFDCDELREFISEKANELKNIYRKDFDKDVKN